MTAPVEVKQPETRSPHGGLWRLLASTGVSLLGQGAVTTSVPLLAATLTRDPFVISVVAAAVPAAWFVVGLPAGALVDRWPRRKVMVAADLVRAVLLVGLSLAVVSGHLPVAALAAVVFLVACANCFFDPAAQAAIPVLAGRDDAALAKANGRIWTLDLFGRSLAGPPLGAALFSIAAVAPFALNSVTFVVSALLLVGITGLGRPEHDEAARQQSILRSVVAGVRFLVGHAQLRLLTLGMGTYNLGYNIAFATFVLFAQDHLHLHARGYGILLSTLAVGGLVGGWLGPRVHARISPAATYAICLAIQGACWLVSLSGNTWLTGASLVVIGAASTTVTVVGGTARQALTPDHLLGRVSAGTRVVGIGSAAIGALLGGALASVGTLGTPAIAAAAVLLASGAFFAVAATAADSRPA